MIDGNDIFERNLERLIRSAAAPPPDPARARREFLDRVEDRAPFNVRIGRRIAMAAALIVVAALLYSAFAPQSPVKPVAPGRQPDEVRTAIPLPGNDPPPDPRPVPSKETPREPAPGPAVPVMAAKDGDFTLACTLTSLRAKEPTLKFAGTAPYPDGTRLKISLFRSTEQSAGGRLVAGSERVAGGFAFAEVESGRFQAPLAWPAPGRCVVTVDLDDSQRRDVAAALKGVPRRPSTFEFPGWGDELAGQLGPKLQSFDALAKECLDQVAKVEKLAAKESAWVKERRNVDPRGADLVLTKEAEEVMKETGRLVTRLETSDLKALYPAALSELLYTVRGMHGNAQHFEYEAGKFARAKSYHAPTEPIKTHRGDAFNFDVLKKYLAEASPLAGREMALWAVKDLRRTGAQMRPDLADALKLFGPHPGLAPLADRLAKAAAADLEGLEKEIRSAP